MEQIGNALQLANDIIQYRVVCGSGLKNYGYDLFRIDILWRVFQPKRFKFQQYFFLMFLPSVRLEPKPERRFPMLEPVAEIQAEPDIKTAQVHVLK